MEWPILTAIAAFAVAAIFVGALFLKIGEPLGYIPQCSDCQFFVKGPASLVQAEGAAYLIRGAMLTPSSILAEYGWAYDGTGRPLKPGQSIYCEKGIFVRVVGGIAQASCNVFSAPIQLAYSGRTPAALLWFFLPRVPAQRNTYNYTLIPVNWRGGIMVVQVNWGYTKASSIADGLYISLFVPISYTKVVAPSDAGLRILPFGGADYTPAGSSLQLFVQFNPYDSAKYDGSIEFAVMNVNGGYGVVQPRGFNPNKNWPTNTWTTYVIYNSTSNTLYVRWIVSGVFDVKYTYDLNTFGSGSYRFTPPPPGQYYIVVGVANGGGYADWQVYSINYYTS